MTPSVICNYCGRPSLFAEQTSLRDALADLRDATDAYVNDMIGVPELAESMDKAYHVLYPDAAEDPS